MKISAWAHVMTELVMSIHAQPIMHKLKAICDKLCETVDFLVRVHTSCIDIQYPGVKVFLPHRMMGRVVISAWNSYHQFHDLEPFREIRSFNQ